MSNTGRGLRDRGRPQSAQSMLANLAVRVENMLRVGRVFEADYIRGKVRVRVGNVGEQPIETDWIPWTSGRAGNTASGNRFWVAPEVGDQVVVCSPSGSLEQSFVMSAMPCKDSFHGASSADVQRQTFQGTAWAVESFYRSQPARDWMLADSGTFFWRVGAQAGITMDKEHIELRVGTTRLRITADSVNVHVAGQSSELLMSPAKITAHVGRAGVVDITAPKVEMAVGGTSKVAVTASDVTLAVVNAVEARLASDASFRAKVAGALLELMPDMLHMNSNGADVQMSGGAYALTATGYDATNGSVAGPAAPGGTALTPAAVSVPAAKVAPTIVDGNAPGYPS